MASIRIYRANNKAKLDNQGGNPAKIWRITEFIPTDVN
jgi:hypothetical protein